MLGEEANRLSGIHTHVDALSLRIWAKACNPVMRKHGAHCGFAGRDDPWPFRVERDPQAPRSRVLGDPSVPQVHAQQIHIAALRQCLEVVCGVPTARAGRTRVDSSRSSGAAAPVANRGAWYAGRPGDCAVTYAPSNQVLDFGVLRVRSHNLSAAGGTRTHTSSRTMPFESIAYADFATAARGYSLDLNSVGCVYADPASTSWSTLGSSFSSSTFHPWEKPRIANAISRICTGTIRSVTTPSRPASRLGAA